MEVNQFRKKYERNWKEDEKMLRTQEKKAREKNNLKRNLVS